MAVVAIIAITAALAAPAISEAMSDRRANEAMHALVRIGAKARSESMAYGRAHVLQYADTSTGPAPNGSLRLWRGNLNLCTATNWNAIMVGDCADNPNCIDALDMGTYSYSTHQVRMRMPNAGSALVCFQPDGEMMVASNGGLFGFAPPSGADGVLFTITRLVGTTPQGVQRSVVFPFGGTPRVIR